jgi:hypothetical protein
MPLEKSFCKPQRLGPGEEQFLSLLNLFLSLFVEFVHSMESGRRILAVGVRMSNQEQLRLQTQSVRIRKFDVAADRPPSP